MGTVPERLPEGWDDPVAVGVAAPELGGDEELVPGGDGAGAHGLGGGLADGDLGVVVRRRVEVAVPYLDGPEDGAADGVRLGPLHRRAHADARHARGRLVAGAHGLSRDLWVGLGRELRV